MRKMRTITNAGVKESRPRRVLAIAPAGGRWIQLLRLRSAFADATVHFATTDAGARRDLSDERARFHALGRINWPRWITTLLAPLLVPLLIIHTKPDVIVTTGGAVGAVAVIFGRMHGARTAWIDTLAHAQQHSRGAKRLGRWIDLWTTPWAQLESNDGPHHLGALL